MFERFKKKEKTIPTENLIELDLEKPIDCLCDFTYNFYWNHQGEEMELHDKIPNNEEYSFQDIVEHLKKGHSVKVNGDVGHRLSSSMGVDIAYFDGTGAPVDVGDVFINGNVASRMGISMRKGSIYVSGEVTDPIGNLVEVKSDVKGYKKFISITELLMENPDLKLIGANLTGKTLEIDDDYVRDTVGARLNKDCEVIISGDVDLSTGILMKKGTVRVEGNAEKNTAALLNGGTVIIDGDCDDFTAVEMKKGEVVVNGDSGKFLGAKKEGGVIFAKKGSPIHPAKKTDLSGEDKNNLQGYKLNPKGFSKFE